MTHPVIDDLRWRKTSKKYDPERKVSEDDLAVFFEALRLSPSSINSQPWKFVVIDSQPARERMYRTFERDHQFNRPHVFESSQIILFAYNPYYTRDDYARVIDQYIADSRIPAENRDKAFASLRFRDMNTDDTGYNGCWTKAQTYLALGNALHTLARMRIDATPLEGIDQVLVNEEFKQELDGYRCDVALAIGYHHVDDSNAKLPKSRLDMDTILLRI
ncbi:MAG: nitroreductase family protein [Gammaproteobacteria bacterium]|nr:nitroreductase family protein [Gammaproteobacteria bacterium]